MGDASTGAGMQHLSANGAAALIAARQITSEEVVTACLEQIERLEPSVEAAPSRNSLAMTTPVSRTSRVRVKRASSVPSSSRRRQ